MNHAYDQGKEHGWFIQSFKNLVLEDWEKFKNKGKNESFNQNILIMMRVYLSYRPIRKH